MSRPSLGCVRCWPLPAHNATLAMAGLVEGWPDAERIGVAEVVPPGEAHERLSQASRARRERGGGEGFVLRPLPRRGEERS
ncbi:MAG: hypothetical protein ACRDZO_03440 [Egibacteraceae bacterium]